jgi:hypothetical protein
VFFTSNSNSSVCAAITLTLSLFVTTIATSALSAPALRRTSISVTMPQTGSPEKRSPSDWNARSSASTTATS